MLRKRWRRIAQAVRFWWQRRTRGWDDSELWNLDITLATMIAPRLKRFKELTCAHPCNKTHERWDADLAIMVAAFETIASDEWFLIQGSRHDAVMEGLRLFAENFGSLWD